MTEKIIKGVYCLTSPSGKRYVGIALSKRGIKRRWKDYKRIDCKNQIKLYNALKKYGPENFKYEVILETNDVDRAKSVEKQLIALWNLQNNKYGYNITSGGDGQIGRVYSKESREKMSKSHKGKKLSEETRQKMSNSRIGRNLSEETCQKISKTRLERNIKKENHPKWGYVTPDETKKKLSELKLKKIIKLENIETKEIVIGYQSILCKELNISDGNLNRDGKTKGWRLINE